MRKDLNIKVDISDTNDLLLAVALARFRINLFITFIIQKKYIFSDNNPYFIDSSTKNIFEDLKIWDEIYPFTYPCDSVSICGETIENSFTFSISDISRKSNDFQFFGWLAQNSSVANILYAKLKNYKNIIIVDSPDDKNFSKSVDIAFISNFQNSNSDQFISSKNISKLSGLSFKVLLRGNKIKRAYKFYRKDCILSFLPLNKNIYQINWKTNNIKSYENINITKSFLLDNLSVIITKDLKIDQIIGEINYSFSSSLKSHSYFNLNKNYFIKNSNQRFYPSNIIKLDISKIKLYNIINTFDKYFNKGKKSLRFFKIKLLILKIYTRFLNIFIFPLYKSLITNNILFVYFRFFLFLLLKRVYFSKKLFIKLFKCIYTNT